MLYCFRDRGRDLLIERPAIITSVDGHRGTVNLTVFFEYGDEDECSRERSGDINNDPRYEDVPHNHQGPSDLLPLPCANTWRWPPRV